VASYLGDADQYKPGLHRPGPPGNLAVVNLNSPICSQQAYIDNPVTGLESALIFSL